MIRNIIFDATNVLFEFNKNNLIYRCGATSSNYDILEDEIFNKVMPLLYAGLIDKKEAVKMSCISLLNSGNNDLVPVCLAIYDKLSSFLKINENMLDLVSSLRVTGYKCYILSNAVDDLICSLNEMKSKKGNFLLFNACMLSFNERLLKPSFAIFEKFCYVNKLEATECLYIDSDVKNLDIAKKLGMNCYDFKGYDKFKEFLIKENMILY